MSSKISPRSVAVSFGRLFQFVVLAALALVLAPRADAADAAYVHVLKNETPDTRFHLSEVEAFADSVVPDDLGGATFGGQSTSTNDIAAAGTFGDGNLAPTIGTTTTLEHGAANKNPNNALEGGGAVWSTANNQATKAQYTLDLGGTFDVTTVRLWPRADGCCTNRWRNLEVQLLDAAQQPIAGTLKLLTLPGGNVPLEVNFLPGPQLPVTADLELWFDGSDIDADGSPDSIVDGATITNWQDKSPNNHDANVVTGDPAYVSSGPNDKAVVGFDGNDQISLTDDLRTHITNADGSYTLITVARYSGGARNRVISVDSGHNWLYGFHGNQTSRWYADGWVNLDDPARGGDTSWHLHTGLMDGAPADPQGLFYRDGVLETDVSSGNGNANGRGGNNTFANYAPDRLALGGWNVSSEFSTCEVAEVILYDRLLSESERAEVEAYLNVKYGIGSGALADTGSTDEDTVLTAVDPGGAEPSLLANDLLSSLSVVSFDATSAAGAAVTVAANGTFSYDPTGAPALQALAPGQTLDDTFTYTARDGAAPTPLGGITANLALWLDATDIDANGSPDTLLDGAAITTWSDKSGNGRDAGLGGGAGNDPSYTVRSSAPINTPVVDFDGNDQLVTSYDFDNLGDDYSIFTVARYSGTNANAGEAERVISSGTHNWLFGFWGQSVERFFAEGWVFQGPQLGTDYDTNWQIHAGIVDGTPANPQIDFYRNGVQLAFNDTGSNDTNYKPGVLSLGAGQSNSSEASIAQIAEVIIYDRELSDVERQAVEDYLERKYLGHSATVTITVSGIDDPLVANNDEYSTDEDTAVGAVALTSLLELNSLATGEYSVTADGETFEAHIDHDGTNGWLLVGRGRQGWAWTDAGLGSVDAVNDNIGTPAAFAPAYYRSAIINDLISGAGVDLTDVEIRLKRAGDPAGTTYQEDRWRSTTQTTWDWVFPDPSRMNVDHEIVSGPFGTQGPHAANTHDEGGNDWQRVFTWAWGGHANEQGFSYGSAITNGSNSATSFLWENANEQHAIPYTEVYIRIPSAPAGTPPASLLANDSEPDNPFFVSAVDTTGTTGLVTVPTGISSGNGSFSYDPNGMFESLNVGDMATDTFAYTVSNIVPASGRFVRVENNGPATRRMDIGEIEVFAPGVTPAVDNAGGGGALNPSTDLATTANGASLHSKGAVSGFSQPHGGDDDPRLIDGAETTGGNTWSSNGVGNFVIIDLGSTQAIGTVRVHQRNDGCCQDRLRDFTVTLLADSGGSPGAVVQSGVFATQPPVNLFGEPPLGPEVIGASETATVTITIKGVNDPPEVTLPGIPNVTIFTATPTLDVPLFPHFEDVDNTDMELSYTVTGNSNPLLVQTAAISSVDGILTLDTPCTLVGTADITVEARDPGGLFVSDTFTVEVKDDVPPFFTGAKDKVYSVAAGTSADASAHFAGIAAADKVDGPIGHTCTLANGDPLPAGNLFPVGVHPIECTATDAAGNSTTVTFNIIVLEIQSTPGERMFDVVSLRGDAAAGTGVPAGATISVVQEAFLNNNNEIIYSSTLAGAGTNNAAVFTGTLLAQSAIATKNTASAGGNYGNFRNLSLNDAAHASFQSQIGSTPGQFLDTGGGPALAALKNGIAPTGGGELFGTLQKPALASGGELLTRANLVLGTGAGVTIGDDTLITSSAGTILVREGDASSVPATTYDQLHPRIVASEDNNHYAFSAFLLEDAGFDPIDNTGLFTGTVGGGLPALVARENDLAPDIADATLKQFLGESVNSSGELALRCNLAGTGIAAQNNEALYTNSGGTLVLVAREGDVAPCLPNNLVAFSRFETFYMGDDGSVCFRAFLKNATATPAVSSATDGSVWRWKDGVLHLVAREGDMANNTDGAIIRTIDGFSCSGAGGIAYWTSFVPGLGDSVTSNNLGAYLDRGVADAAPELILRRSDTFDLGGDIRTVVGIKLSAEENSGGGTGGYGRTINDAGNVLLNLRLSGNQSGIFVLSP